LCFVRSQCRSAVIGGSLNPPPFSPGPPGRGRCSCPNSSSDTPSPQTSASQRCPRASLKATVARSRRERRVEAVPTDSTRAAPTIPSPPRLTGLAETTTQWRSRWPQTTPAASQRPHVWRQPAVAGSRYTGNVTGSPPPDVTPTTLLRNTLARRARRRNVKRSADSPRAKHLEAVCRQSHSDRDRQTRQLDPSHSAGPSTRHPTTD
jgi:hypothetical protein